MWLPDNIWGPAWVSWRKSPGYYGWAPLGHGRDYDNDHDRWTFVKNNDIDRDDISRHYIDRSQNVTIIRNSTNITNTHNDAKRNATYEAGPDRDDVQKNTGRPIKSMAIQDNDKPGQSVNNGQLKIYRPQVQKENGNGQKTAPAKVTNLHDVKPASERNGNDQQKATPSDNSNGREQPQQLQKIEPAGTKGNEKSPAIDPKKNNGSTQPAQQNGKRPKKSKRQPK
jgi:hypothetical protein